MEKQQIKLTVDKQSKTLQEDIQHLITELGVDGVQALIHAYKTEKSLRNGVKDKVLKVKKKLSKGTQKRGSVFDMLSL